MPYIRPFADGYAVCPPHARGAFLVDQSTIDTWDRLCSVQGNRPTNHHGYRVRPYPAMDVASHAPYAPSGVYADHADRVVEADAYAMRDRLLREQSGSRQEVLQTIATALGMRHWRDAYNATRNVGRRITGESGRNGQGELVWRRWSTRFTPAALAAATASPYRAYGIEIEFLESNARPGIARDLAAAGIDHVVDWGRWHRIPGRSGWHCTYDSTVSGGEIISDIMDGSATSRDEVAAVLAIVRSNGGRPGPGQGMHIHHDVRDFTVADRVRLVDNIEACQSTILAFVGARTSSHWCRPMTAREFADVHRTVAAGQSGHNDHGVAWNFGHLTGRGSIEFRALGNTLNGRKVRAWIQMGQAMIAATKAGVTFPANIGTASMLATLVAHGMSRWAAEVFATRCGVAIPVAA